ncbi:hypothetical protein V1514DRAFT_329764 [Lipomyces japonicus]|uniref:uncharacterized protein n=1 Tax=Lipomyces japonicus TaxID=56871 RepID=UPI0034CF61A5
MSSRFSCTECRRRKVKCDKIIPSCSTCIKSVGALTCEYVKPPPPRRRRRGGHNQLRPDKDNIQNEHYLPTSRFITLDAHDETGSHRSRFIDSYIWAALSKDLPADEILADTGPVVSDTSNAVRDANLLLCLANPVMTPTTKSSTLSLPSEHPSPIHMLTLWQYYVDNVDPMIKIHHVPSFQKQLLTYAATPDKLKALPLSNKIHAILFSMYAVAVGSITDLQCRSVLAEPKQDLLARFRTATASSLSACGFTRSSDLDVLRALTHYLFAIRAVCDSSTFWLLTGTAVRIAHRLGVNRRPESTTISTSIFDSEMRNRLWLQLLLLDTSAAKSCGTSTFPLITGNVDQLPMNVTDVELFPGMTLIPTQISRITDVCFCLLRAKVVAFLMRIQNLLRTASVTDVNMAGIDDVWHHVSLAKVDEFEADVNDQILILVDMSVPLQYFTFYVAKIIFAKMRFVAMHPFAPNTKSNTASMQKCFDCAIAVIKYSNILLQNRDMDRFGWHTHIHVPLDGFLFAVSFLTSSVAAATIGDDHARSCWNQMMLLISSLLSSPFAISDRIVWLGLRQLFAKAWKKLQYGLPPIVYEFLKPEIAETPSSCSDDSDPDRSSSGIGSNSTSNNNNDGDYDENDDNTNFGPFAVDWAEWQSIFDSATDQFDFSLFNP